MSHHLRLVFIVAAVSLLLLNSCTASPTIYRVQDRQTIDAYKLADQKSETAAKQSRLSLCISGGGYRSTLFSLGAVMALNDMGVLRHVQQLGGVSGGAITAAHLKVHWNDFALDESSKRTPLSTSFVSELLELTSKTIDVPLVLKGVLSPGASTSLLLAEKLDSQLFDGRLVSELDTDSGPVLTLSATNMATGSLILANGTHIVREIDLLRDIDPHLSMPINPWFYDSSKVPLAYAVAASAGFPPFFAPARWKLVDERDLAADGDDEDETFTLLLGDGGLIDNLSVSSCNTNNVKILVDAGEVEVASGESYGNWMSTLKSSVDVIHRSQTKAMLDLNAKDWTSYETRSVDQLVERLSSSDGGDAVSYHILLYPKSSRATSKVVSTWLLDRMLIDLAPENMTLRPSSINSLYGLCASIDTRLAKVDKPTQRGLIQWGYLNAWASVDGFEKARELNAARDKAAQEILSSPDVDSDLLALSNELNEAIERKAEITEWQLRSRLEKRLLTDHGVPCRISNTTLRDPRYRPPFRGEDSCLFEPESEGRVSIFKEPLECT